MRIANDWASARSANRAPQIQYAPVHVNNYAIERLKAPQVNHETAGVEK
jgi:hypothetical protein